MLETDWRLYVCVFCVCSGSNASQKVEMVEINWKFMSVSVCLGQTRHKKLKSVTRVEGFGMCVFGSNASRKVEISEATWRFWSACFGSNASQKVNILEAKKRFKIVFCANVFTISIFSHSVLVLHTNSFWDPKTNCVCVPAWTAVTIITKPQF